MSEWIMLVPSFVFNRIKTEFSEEVKTRLAMTGDNFSAVDSRNKKAVFPFVYVHALPASELGQDLEGNTINAGLFTFQVDVIDNKTQNRAREVMSEIVRIMKAMRFEIIAMPEFDSDETHRFVARFRRAIGSSDVL